MEQYGCACRKKTGTSYGGSYDKTCVSGCCDVYQNAKFTRGISYKSFTVNTCIGPTCGAYKTQKTAGSYKSFKCSWLAVNPEMSVSDTRKKKAQTVIDAIYTIKSTIYSNITDKSLYTKTTEEQYKEYFRKLSESALTKSEQALLIDQLTTDFVENNALNLFINVQSIASNQKKTINNKEIKEIIHQTMKNVLPNIITSYNYGEDFLKMNYANAYQTMYYAISLYLYSFKWSIITQCYTVYINELPKEDN